METDKATAIREARVRLRAEGKLDSMNAVVSLLHCSKRTARRYWQASDPEEGEAPPPPVPAPVPAAPEPEPPAFSLENLRAYYLNRFESPWPQGIVPPVEAYPVLQALRQEWDAEIGKADRQRYDVMNALAHLRDIDDHPQMRAVDNRRGVARLMLHSVQSDMDIVRRNAHDHGITFPDPRLS